MKINVSVIKGINKNKCEDSVLINSEVVTEQVKCIETDNFICAFVADGVGGTAGGREASRFVLKKLSEAMGKMDSETALRELIVHINENLIALGKAAGTPRMATTLTGFVKFENQYFLIHIGNTRLNVLQGKYLKQITEDQTTYQWLKNTGNYEAAENCNKSEIRSCLGGGMIDYSKGIVIKQIFNTGLPQFLLLTSDGIHDYADIDTIEEVLSAGLTDRKIMEELVDTALENGSDDDKSIVLIRNR